MNLQLTYPCVMGICNITPDSFYDGGTYINPKDALIHIESMVQQGASIIDIGAYSSRPGAQHISFDEEYSRLAPILKEVKKHFSQTIISIDTFRSTIVERVYADFGDCIVNDISGGNIDADILHVCGKHSLPYICMHMQGTPQTMQNTTTYTDVMCDIYSFFQTQITHAHQSGIQTICIDPGFGFGKTIEQNYEILRNLSSFQSLNAPIVVGISRKSMIYKVLDTTPSNTLNGTSALHSLALQNGASILRVHDVREAIEVIALYKKYIAN